MNRLRIFGWKNSRKAWVLPLAVLLFSSGSWAQVSESADKDTGDCDRYASIDDIPSKGIKKAAYGFIDIDLALPPCSAAYAKNPKNSRVQAQLARIYFQQGKFEQGIELARASAKDHAIALAILGEANRRGVGGISLNPREAARYFQQGTDRGSADSMNSLAKAYLIGIGVEKDEAKALSLLQKAAALGEGNAVYSFSLFHAAGRFGIAKNPDEAANLIRKLADSGAYPPAQVLMGQLIVQREKRLTSEASDYLALALPKLERLAGQDSAEARFILANCYRFGLGVTKDPVKTLNLYRKAAEHNYVPAVAQAGIALAEGIGTEKNVPEARKLLERASAMGSDEADKALASLWGK